MIEFYLKYCIYDSFAHMEVGATRWPSWLRHCATSGKVAGSIPDGVTGIFH
jgi:hypothetical protein